MAQNPLNTRSLLFGVALFLAGALASWNIRNEGQETGLLRFGGRFRHEISRTNDPEKFEFWSNFFAASTFGCILAVLGVFWLIWYLKKKRVRLPN